jgi:phosphopentomutase
MFHRAIVIVLDSVGIGALPDASAYRDEGSDTLGHILAAVPLKVPTLASLGLAWLVDLPRPVAPGGAFGRMAERSAGKDSVTGHWELMGLELDRAFPTFPAGFPGETIAAFEERIGRGVLGNVVASGTAIIDELGASHVATGKPIVYTSADSVFQIAAHEEVVPVPQLYAWCEIAYDLTVRGLGIGRVIARPFVGRAGAFTRTANRRDFAMPPTGETLLDRLAVAHIQVTSIGKIDDLFAGRATGRVVHTTSDADGMRAVHEAMRDQADGLIFVNLVDFDTLYGHRNDVAGYAANLECFDARLAELLPTLTARDVLIVTADHGNDPATPSTDHSREYVPVLVAGRMVQAGVDLGTRSTFADLGQTLAQLFGVGSLAYGRSFLDEIALVQAGGLNAD